MGYSSFRKDVTTTLYIVWAAFLHILPSRRYTLSGYLELISPAPSLYLVSPPGIDIGFTAHSRYPILLTSSASTRTLRMENDEEKADVATKKHTPQDYDVPIEHPGISTSPDEDEKRMPSDLDSIHSQHSHPSSDSIEPIPEEKEPAQRSKSKTSSVRSRPLSIVARHKRRGLLARFALIPEVDRPYDYKRSTKWLITLIIALAAAAAPIGSAIMMREY